MLIPQRRITFTSSTTSQQLVYDYVCEIEINKSYLNLTQTATIKLPRKLVYKTGSELTPNNQGSQLDYIQPTALSDTKNIIYVGGQNYTVNAMFKRGDKVQIEIGFYPNLITRFSGYISAVISGADIEISCEDNMWLLKQSAVYYPDPKNHVFITKKKHVYESAANASTLKQLLDGILGFVSHKIEYKTVDDNMNLGHFIVKDGINAAKVLEILKDNFGLFSYFRDDGVLYVGFANNAQVTNKQEFWFDGYEGNILNNHSLKWQNEDDVPIKVRGVSINFDNKTFNYEAGQEGGDSITQYYYNLDEAALKKIVDNSLPNYTYTGWRGDFTTLGEPTISFGDIGSLNSLLLPERNGSYLVKGVHITDGVNGYFQKVNLGMALQ